MANRKVKTLDEQISDLRNDINKKNNRLKALQKRKTQEDRKKRTRRLIQIGGAVESVLKKSLGDEEGILQDGDIEAVINFLQVQEDRGKYFSKAILDEREKNNPHDTDQNVPDEPHPVS